MAAGYDVAGAPRLRRGGGADPLVLAHRVRRSQNQFSKTAEVGRSTGYAPKVVAYRKASPVRLCCRARQRPIGKVASRMALLIVLCDPTQRRLRQLATPDPLPTPHRWYR